VAGVADVLLHALRCRPELEALVMVQGAVSQALLGPDFLRSKLPGNRNGRLRAVVDLVLPRADSLLEVLAHTHFTRAGLKVQMHVDIPGVGEVDCWIEDCRSSNWTARHISRRNRSKRTTTGTTPLSGVDD
jgi:hypothetical protein